MNLNKKQINLIKIVVVCLIVILILWFLILSPYLTFKKNEKIVESAAKRYYEINSGQLPTGQKIKTVPLQTLYEKDFISSDLRSSYTKKVCDAKSSWVKVRKQEGEYKYYVYLKCGVFQSKVDHEGPEIKLKGEEELTIHKNEKYKELGVDSVTDKTDGKLDIKKVEINNKKVNTNKVGEYEVTYKIKDSFGNETVKIRTIHVIETLNHIVEKDTQSKNVYRGSWDNNYVKLDGILFKIVGINEDDTVKIVTDQNIAAVNYEGVDSWLNEYFYEKLSDSAKKLIVKSKWCNEEINNPEGYTKCNSYGKKQNVGLLSIADINNSKGEDESYNIMSDLVFWTSNKNTNNKSWASSYFNMSENGFEQYKELNDYSIIQIKPALNIKKDTLVVSGDGSLIEPYILKGNKKTLKAGSKISDAKTGEYFKYSGYIWRVVGRESDGTTQVIMQDALSNDNGTLYTKFGDKINHYNPNKKSTLGYVIVNEAPTYLKTNYFDKKQVSIDTYDKLVKYKESSKKETYSIKLIVTSLFDLYSANPNDIASTWYRESSKSKEKVYYNSMTLGVIEDNFDKNQEYGVKLTAYLNKNVVVKSGDGTSSNPYTITK